MCKKVGFERPPQRQQQTIQDLEATVRKIYFLGLLYVGLSLVYLLRAPDPGAISDDPPVTVTVPDDPPFTVTITVGGEPEVDPTDAAAWFRSMKPYCNPVEVATQVTRSPAPRSADGAAYEAACYALAGRIDTAAKAPSPPSATARARSSASRKASVIPWAVMGSLK